MFIWLCNRKQDFINLQHDKIGNFAQVFGGAILNSVLIRGSKPFLSNVLHLSDVSTACAESLHCNYTANCAVSH